MYLIPATAWLSPNRLFVSRDYAGRRSKPEWGIQLTRARLPMLQPFRLEEAVKAL